MSERIITDTDIINDNLDEIERMARRVAELEKELKSTESRLHEVSVYCAELLQMMDTEHIKASEAK